MISKTSLMKRMVLKLVVVTKMVRRNLPKCMMVMKRKILVNLTNTKDIIEKKMSTDQKTFLVNYKIIHQGLGQMQEKKVFTFVKGKQSNISQKVQTHIDQLNAGARKGYSFKLINYSEYKN